MDLRADRARIARIADNDDDPAPIPDDVASVLQTPAANGVTLTPCGDVKDNRAVQLDPEFHAQPSHKVGHWTSRLWGAARLPDTDPGCGVA